MEDRAGRPDSVRSLCETLVCEHGFTGSYRSVQRRCSGGVRHPGCGRFDGSRWARALPLGGSLLKLSGLPVGKSLESMDFAFQRSVDKSQIDLLAASELVRRKERRGSFGDVELRDS